LWNQNTPIGGVQLAFNTDFVYSKSNAITGFEALSLPARQSKSRDLQF
jgi:hypothetical protein